MFISYLQSKGSWKTFLQPGWVSAITPSAALIFLYYYVVFFTLLHFLLRFIWMAAVWVMCNVHFSICMHITSVYTRIMFVSAVSSPWQRNVCSHWSPRQADVLWTLSWTNRLGCRGMICLVMRTTWPESRLDVNLCCEVQLTEIRGKSVEVILPVVACFSEERSKFLKGSLASQFQVLAASVRALQASGSFLFWSKLNLHHKCILFLHQQSGFHLNIKQILWVCQKHIGRNIVSRYSVFATSQVTR